MVEKQAKRLIRFDWAMKHLLRNKANYDIVEGFLCALLNDNEISVLEILESESNQENDKDKFNRVDVLVKDNKGRNIIIEIQNSRESDYLFRILYGVSKSITESINIGDDYKKISKVISVNILYFDLGIGEDYLYYGSTDFVGMNNGERITKDDEKIKKLIPKETKYNSLEIFPEYYLIQVEKYPNIVEKAIDEWIYWFKNEQVKEGSHSKNIDKVQKKLDLLKMSEKERKKYEAYLGKLASERNIMETAHEDGRKEGIEEGRKEVYSKLLPQIEQEKKEKQKVQQESAKALKEAGLPIHKIIEITGLSEKEIKKL